MFQLIEELWQFGMVTPEGASGRVGGDAAVCAETSIASAVAAVRPPSSSAVPLAYRVLRAAPCRPCCRA